MITYHQLRTFLAVARTGSLTKVARELNATQPTVSLQLNALRKFAGMPLFDRPGGRFRLTPAGEKLHRYAEETLGNLRILQQDFAALKGTLAGPLALGATFVISRYVLPSTLSSFREQFPGVDLQLHVDFPQPLFSGLFAKTLDVACYIGVDTPPGLTVEPLCDERFVVFASPRHRLAGQSHVSPDELSREPFVVSATAVLRDVIEAKLRAVDVVPKVVAEGRHHDAIKQLVERDVGYSMLIEASVADELANGRLVEMRLAGPPMFGKIVIAYPTRSATPPLIRSFIEFVRGRLNAGRQGARLTAGRVPRKTRRKGPKRA
jgi:LysR family transcriptional regulator, transcriptional activator of the cysJI operon